MKKSKRLLALFMSVVMMMGAFFVYPSTTDAADINVNMVFSGWDEGRAANLWNGGTITGELEFPILHISDSKMLYCIEPGEPISGGEGMDINNYVNKLHTPSIKDDYRVTELLGRLFQYVDYDKSGSPLSTNKASSTHQLPYPSLMRGFGVSFCIFLL